jgi:hypothetical protein
MNPIRFTVLVNLASLLAGGSLFGQSTVITYQGRVPSGGDDFTGTGQFKFTLMNRENGGAK